MLTDFKKPTVDPPVDDSPDAINPVSNPIQGPQPAPAAPGEGPMFELTTEPTTGSSKVGSPSFIGNALWVTPGSLVSLGNTVWGKLQPTRYLDS